MDARYSVEHQYGKKNVNDFHVLFFKNDFGVMPCFYFVKLVESQVKSNKLFLDLHGDNPRN
jgi:hypothetical protein